MIEATIGQVFNILLEDLGSTNRGPARVALARQVAMYLTHVACGLTLTDVGRLFARDRTTVAHACAVVEDLRDDAKFDRVLELVEMIVTFQLQAREPRSAA
ncbi:MAG: chromosomal replication initiator DnaA [Hyphomicrobium sp.]|nr:chromosomal replication initiator DnaA [Hyphomicrobium sp.]PPD06197.1 MAG: chromosomal replication initiator DnaA [Hyphomicrobium sp.]